MQGGGNQGNLGPPHPTMSAKAKNSLAIPPEAPEADPSPSRAEVVALEPHLEAKRTHPEAGRLTMGRSQMAFAPENTLNRPTVAEVDLDALLSNLAETRRLCPAARVLAVVKANAYGHGAVPVSVALEEAGVDFFGVSLVEEGAELRQAGVRGDILVLGGAYSDYEEIVAHGLVPVVFTGEHLAQLQAAAARAGCTARAHLKLDTGMGRLGLDLEGLGEFLAALEMCPNVELDGLLSHLANAEVREHPMNRLQIARFKQAATALRAAGHPIRWRHIANSAGAMDLADAKDGREFNLVRPGLILYGEAPSERLRAAAALQPVLSWKTSVAHLKRLGPGQPVSYGGTWTAPRESLIATLPVGYADGFSRRHSNRGEVLVRGRRAKVVGAVCMDMCMVDVTEIAGVSVHDEVVLLGCQGEERLSAEELARTCETIPYEILCSVGARVPRAVVRRSR